MAVFMNFQISLFCGIASITQTVGLLGQPPDSVRNRCLGRNMSGRFWLISTTVIRRTHHIIDSSPEFTAHRVAPTIHTIPSLTVSMHDSSLCEASLPWRKSWIQEGLRFCELWFWCHWQHFWFSDGLYLIKYNVFSRTTTAGTNKLVPFWFEAQQKNEWKSIDSFWCTSGVIGCRPQWRCELSMVSAGWNWLPWSFSVHLN